MLEALLMRLRKDALEGDIKAIDRLLRLIQMQAAMAPSDEDDTAPVFNAADDQAILKELAGWSKDTLSSDAAIEVDLETDISS